MSAQTLKILRTAMKHPDILKEIIIESYSFRHLTGKVYYQKN